MKTTWIVALVLGLCGTASAQVCEPQDTQQALQYLRRLSLDLRGRTPSFEELSAVAQSGQVDPALIDQMLASDEFLTEVRAYHRELLWTNLASQRLAQFSWIMQGPGLYRMMMTPAYWTPGRAVLYRGVQEPCLDQPATFDAMGAIQTTVDATRPTVKKEGWVEVSPYWAPGTTVKVCAFDAQSAATGLAANGTTVVDCTKQTNSTQCGCGANLRRCQSATDKTEAAITSAMAEQMFRFMDAVVRDDRPYTDILLAKDVEVNGPLSHYFQYQTGGGGTLILATANQNYPVPDIPFPQKDTWMKMDRGHRHSGVLTLPGYLLKFQSDRGRANRFYNAFLCQSFQAPPGGLPAASDDCHQEPDLTQRCGCMYCHVSVEPAAAFWGRWSQAGIIPMEDDLFPRMRADCADPRRNNSNVCKLFYLTEAHTEKEMPFVGQLLPYVFADDQRVANIDIGPEGIAQQAVSSGTFAECTSKKLWTRLLAHAAIADQDMPAIVELADGFSRGSYSLRALVKTIVTRPEYVQGESFGMEKQP